MLANPNIFKAYDIRGEWNKDWDSEFVYKIGKAIAFDLKPKTVAIGRDMRLSSDEIFAQISKSFLEMGIDVLNLGLCATELTYFAANFIEGVDLAVMITASHNPGKDNGLKITKKGGQNLGLNCGLDRIKDIFFLDVNHLNIDNLSDCSPKGRMIEKDIWNDYRKHIIQLAEASIKEISNKKILAEASIKEVGNKKIIVDPANGMGSYIFDKVFYDLPVSKMFWNLDGTFPNHPADPSREDNLKALKQRILSEKADLGISLDGDGDRVFFIDDKGRFISGYYLAALMTNYLLEKSPAANEKKIVFDPRYYWAIKEVINKYRAEGIKSKAGSTLVKNIMRDCNAIFAIENAGHVFFGDNKFSDSSALAILLVLKMIKEKGSLSGLADPLFEKYPMSGEINFVVDDVKLVLEKIEHKYNNGEMSKLDGIGVDFEHWRFNVRGSNTQQLLRLNIEAKTEELVREKVEELKELIGGEVFNK